MEGKEQAYNDIKLIYLDALAAIFMNYRESDSFNVYSSCRLSKVRLSGERMDSERL